MKNENPTTIATVIKIAVIVTSCVCWIIAFLSIRRTNLSTTESTLLGFILTIFSVLAGWLITHFYSTEQQKTAIEEAQEHHKETLRTFALKAAEKVNNLSNELSKLAIFMNDILDADFEKSEENLLAIEERLVSAIHIINTLKSINDTALSDWKGVIGDEIQQQQQQEKQAITDYIQSTTKEIEALRLAIESIKSDTTGKQLESALLTKEILSLQHNIKMAASRISDNNQFGSRVPKRKNATNLISCPTCQADLSYSQRNKAGTVKVVSCAHCRNKFLSKPIGDDLFSIEPIQVIKESIGCPDCLCSFIVDLPNRPGSAIETKCGNCGAGLRIIRAHDEIRIKPYNPQSIAASQAINTNLGQQSPTQTLPKLDPELLEKVKLALPPQPWPVDTHKKVGASLGLDPATVRFAINELIKTKQVHYQLDGNLYDITPITSPASSGPQLSAGTV